MLTWGPGHGVDLTRHNINSKLKFYREHLHALFPSWSNSPLFFVGGKESKMLESMSEEDLYTLTHFNVTANYHRMCLTPEVIICVEWRVTFLLKICHNLWGWHWNGLRSSKWAWNKIEKPRVGVEIFYPYFFYCYHTLSCQLMPFQHTLKPA